MRPSRHLLSLVATIAVIVAALVVMVTISLVTQTHRTAAKAPAARNPSVSNSIASKKRGLPAGPGEVRSLLPGESFVPGVGAHWLPVGGGKAAPVIDSVKAIALATKSGIPGGLEASATPEATLATFTNEVKGTIQADNSVILDDQNIVAWVLRYANTPVHVHGPGIGASSGPSAGPAKACDLFVVVDASTGAIREAFQSCSRQVG